MFFGGADSLRSKTEQSLQGGPAAELASAAPAWHATRARLGEPQPTEARVRECVRRLLAFPALVPIDPTVLASAIWALPLGRAPGPDGWTGDDLRLWLSQKS